MNVPLASSVLGPTCFAPAERTSFQKLEEQYTSILLDDLVDAHMQAVPGYAMLINQQRQIVAVNSKVLGITGVHESHALVGKRPGEAVNCVHSGDTILTVRSHSGATAKKERFFVFSGVRTVVLFLPVLSTLLLIQVDIWGSSERNHTTGT